MPTTEATPTTSKLSRALGIVFLALTTLVAVGVALAFLILLGSAHANPGGQLRAPRHPPLIELRSVTTRPSASVIRSHLAPPTRGAVYRPSYRPCSSTVRSAVGTASSRLSEMGSPLWIESPYVPADSRSSARSRARSCS